MMSLLDILIIVTSALVFVVSPWQIGRKIGVVFLSKAIVLLHLIENTLHYENGLIVILFITSELIILFLFFYYAFNKKYAKYNILAIAVVFLLLGSQLSIPWSSISFRWVLKCLTGDIALTLSILYFKKLINELPVFYIHQYPMFWFNSAFFLYYGGYLMLLFLNAEGGGSYSIYVLQNLVILKASFISVGLVYNRKQKSLND